MDQNPAELLKSILNTAERHPNAKVSKLIKCFEVDKTPQNIALLLIELAEHPEFSSDISISLRYYLDCFKNLRQEPSFAEAGVVLFNSSKIYAKRVDHIHNEIERLIISLSNVENTEQNPANPDPTQNAVKVKRGRKRNLEQINGTIEANMNAKRFKKLSNNKRFDSITSKRNNSMKTLAQHPDKSIKSYIPQSTWQYSAIEDFDYEDEVDSKKNYKLFTYHLEHRYNTLIPDINFKMYFKIKDFINGDCNDSALPESWPPLSDAYIEQFLDLEDVILLKEGHLGKSREKIDAPRLKNACNISFGNSNTKKFNSSSTIADSGIEFDVSDSQTEHNLHTQLLDPQISLCEINSLSNSLVNNTTTPTDCGIEASQTQLYESTQPIDSQISLCEINSLSNSLVNNTTTPTDCGIEASQTQLNESAQPIDSQISLCEMNSSSKSLDSGIGLDTSIQSEPTDPSQISLLDSNQTIGDSLNISSQSPEMYEQMVKDLSALRNENAIQENEDNVKVTIENDPTLLDPSKTQVEDLSTLKIILPHLPDEGIFFSDLDEKDKQMLSPAVVTQDVFRCIKDKSNIVIKVDDAIEQLFKIREPSDEFLSLPLYERQHFSLRLNIMKIPLKYFNKQRRFKLGTEFDLLKKDRLKKYLKRSSVISRSAIKKWSCISKDLSGGKEHISPPATPSYEPDWLGFPEEELENSIDKNRTMSRDSGISLPQTDRENIEDFVESSDLLSSTIISIPIKDGSIQLEEIQNVKTATNVSEELPISLEKSSQNIEQTNNPTLDNVVVESNDKTNSNDKINTNDDNQSNQLDELNEENRVRTKVHEWHSHLQPILACSRERHHFDVFALGTEIMTQFDRKDVCSEKVSFKNVMEQKDESLISRYFLSMLLLANQGNIIIDVQNKSTNGPSELHDIRLKLMSRTRNIVSLEDNIGIRTPPATTTQQINEQPIEAIVRTLKSVPEVPKMDDRDSGVAMSEALTV